MNTQKLNPAEQKVHDRFVWCGKNAKEWTEQCKWLLLEVEEMKIWKKLGFECIYHYAAALAGMSRYAAEDALWILRKFVDKPILREVAKEKGLAAVRPVLGVVTKETEEFWAEKARTMTKNTLEMYVKEFKKQMEQEETSNVPEVSKHQEEEKQTVPVQTGENFDRLESRPRTTGLSENVQIPIFNAQTENPSETQTEIIPTKTFTITLDPETASELLKLKGQGDWNSLMKELLELRREKLEAEKPEPVRTESRAIPAKIEKWAVAKTRGQCGYPGCAKPHKILHHTQRWALDHVHDPDKIVPLCTAHERIAHQSLIENEDKSTNEWRVRGEAIWWDLKYSIDQQVMAYRMPT